MIVEKCPFLLYSANQIKIGERGVSLENRKIEDRICKSVLFQNRSKNEITTPSYYNIVNISIELNFFYMQSVPIYIM